MTKYIFVTGGVVSGLGKGVSAAALGRLLKSRGYKVFVQKFDPYLNVDPGTMSPYQHGEVYVTADGAETDLDLGHYERFIGERFTKTSNYVQGKLLQEIINDERNGAYGGNTIQIIPHVSNKIINKLEEAKKESGADFIITEIGGTVGDIESQAFFYAVSQFSRHNDSYFIHATFVPFLEASEEFKSKPTQNSIAELNSRGIIPNMILLRANKDIPKNIIHKVADKALMDHDKVIPVPNVDNIYKVPLHFENYKMANKILEYFNMEQREAELSDWKGYVKKLDSKRDMTINIGMVGKYVEFEDAYKSIIEAINISATWNKVDLNLKWINSEKLDKKKISNSLRGLNGVLILPGFGKRGFDGKVVTAEYCREKDLPTLGICYGMQAMTVAQAKLKGIDDATSSEVSKDGTFVIDYIRGKDIEDKMGGTLRLGISETLIKKGSVLEKIYKSNSSFERHRHRFEVNPAFIPVLEDEKFSFSGYDKETGLAEVCERSDKKFYIGLQAHPEFEANPLKPHPVFEAFIKSMKKSR